MTNIMDEQTNNITLDKLIAQDEISPISIQTIHLLTDDLEKFIVAIAWNDLDGSHFKMFKKQEHFKVLAFNKFLSTYNKQWHEKAVKWLNSPRIPLKLNA
jgi:hypothetical protein